MTVRAAFDRAVPDGGYAWWYVDALSDEDPRCGLAIIGFVGSVFSPYYALARRRGRADPLDHCSINVGLYLPRGSYWSMTERPRGSMSRSASHLAVGPSSMRWDGACLRIDLDELAVPKLARLRGTIRVHPSGSPDREFDLDEAGRHRWRPLAPLARVEVEFTRPAMRWSGTGYWDCNHGAEPLERGFHRWQWARTHLPDGVTAIDYDAVARVGGRTQLRLRIEGDTVASTARAPDPIALPRSAWGIERAAACEGGAARIARSLEDGPFYARSLLDVTIGGRPATTMHESLSLDRFGSAWVQALLPFKMPRALRATPPA